MDRHTTWSWLAVLLGAACLGAPLAPHASAQEAVLVGRIAHTEGQVLRFVPDTQDWVATVQDAPFGLHDALYAAPSARAELIMPNGLWVRIGTSTQIQLLALTSDASALDLASGVARFYNKSTTGVVRATTPFGAVLAEPHATFDLYVGEQSVEVIALQGAVAFLHKATNTRYDVVPGGSSILANATQVASGDGNLDAAWDDWNAGRDRVWAQRAQAQGASVRHVPPQLQDDAYVLEENGRWERVYYAGAYHEFWRPTTVAATWQPFTVGRWTDWYGDQCWVPEEPFGYVTHHYGNWVVVNGRWYWAPPVATVTVTTGPLLGFAWYPGRVAWIYSDVDVGWVPLAPTEVYYAHRAWGPRAVVVATAPAIRISIGRLAFAHAAVVVPQTAFYAVPTYTSVRVRQINQTTIVNHFRPAPVVNTTVIHNYTQITNKYNFTNVPVPQKPHSEVVTRINHNQQIAVQQAPTVNAAAWQRTLAGTQPAAPAPQATVPPPTVLNRLVPANQVHAPASQVQFRPVEVKTHPKPVAASPAGQPATGTPPGAPRVPPHPPGAPTPQLGQPTPLPSLRPGTPGGQSPSGVPGTPPASPGAAGVPSLRPRPPGAAGTQPHSPGAPTPQLGQPTPLPSLRPGTPGGQTPPSQPTPPPGPRPGTAGGQPPSGAPGIPLPRPGGQPPRPGEPTQRPEAQRPSGKPPAPAAPGMGLPTSTPGTQPPGRGRPGEQGPPSMGQPPQGQQPGVGRPGAQPPLAIPQQARPVQPPPAQQPRPAQPPLATPQQARPAQPPLVQQPRPAQPSQQQQQQKKKPGEEQKQP